METGKFASTRCRRGQSPRPASGIAHFDELSAHATKAAPEHRLVTLRDVGGLAAFLASDAAKSITGNICYVDAGYHVTG